ncbi:hypothetical protein JCM14469_30350 [Desulfatiferula olefinivorans]
MVGGNPVKRRHRESPGWTMMFSLSVEQFRKLIRKKPGVKDFPDILSADGLKNRSDQDTP